jgi:REP element-mobilizing transposase RayT
MPRPHRRDEPGLVHHVFVRGIARRAIFEGRDDVRHFQSLLAREVRSGSIQVLCFSCLANHFHVVVRSLTGDLSQTMGRVLRAYVRRFNRRRGRDGPLFRSRFGSRPVDSEGYYGLLHRYVDENPVRAGLVQRAEDYPYGSAARLAAGRRPKWLDTRWVDRRLDASRAQGRGATYAASVGGELEPWQRWVVERRRRGARVEEDAFDELLGDGATGARTWLRRRAEVADGRLPSAPVAAEAVVARACEWGRRKGGAWEVTGEPGGGVSAWDVLDVALRIELSGLEVREVALGTGRSLEEVRRMLRLHRRCVGSDEAYVERSARVVRWCVEQMVK